MDTNTLLLDLLRTELVQKVQNEWQTHWQTHYGDYADLRTLSSSHRLLQDLAEAVSMATETRLGKDEVRAKSLTISGITLLRFVQNSHAPSEKTKDMIAIYLGYAAWQAFAEKHTPKMPKIPFYKKIAWRKVGLVSLGFLSGCVLCTLFFYIFVLPEVFPKFSYEPRYSFDVYGKDKLDLLFTVQLSGQIETNAYRRLPHLDSAWLDLVYTPENPSRRRIIDKTAVRSKAQWTMGNTGNPTNYKIYDARILHQTPDSAIVETKEHWKLNYYDLVNKKYCYDYDETDEQIYYLRKIQDRWKIYLIEHKKQGVSYLVK